LPRQEVGEFPATAFTTESPIVVLDPVPLQRSGNQTYFLSPLLMLWVLDLTNKSLGGGSSTSASMKEGPLRPPFPFPLVRA
jgi:hypothetical protein